MKFLSFVVLSFWTFISFGQQTPQYSQFMINKFLYNPAFAGYEDYVDIKSSYRNQWSGLGIQANSIYLSANAPIGKTDYTSDGPTPTNQGKGPKRTHLRTDTFQGEPHQGLGFQLTSDQFGPITNTFASLSYAYHFSIYGEKKFAAAFSYGTYFRSIDLSPGAFDVFQQSDPLLLATEKLNSSQSLINLGALYYDRDFYLGISAFQPIMEGYNYTNSTRTEMYKIKIQPSLDGKYLIPGSFDWPENAIVSSSPDFIAQTSTVYSQNGQWYISDDLKSDSIFVKKTNNSFGQMAPSVQLQTGFKKVLNENWKIYPSALIKYINKNQITFEGNLRMSFKDAFWFGGSYRHREAINFLVGAQISSNLSINYSYDNHSIGLFQRSYSSHEFTIGYMMYWNKKRN